MNRNACPQWFRNHCPQSPKYAALSGHVNAIHEHNAKRQIEADVKSVIGVSIAMGIAEPLPLWVDKMPIIMFRQGSELLHSESAVAAEFEVPLDPNVGGLVGRITFGVPNDLDDLENKRLARGDATAATERRTSGLSTVLSNTSPRGDELRSAASLLFDAFAASQAGMAIALAVMSMETILLERKETDNVMARLAEAVAYHLGRSDAERKSRRKQVKALYDARSGFVHRGKVDQPSTAVSDARRIAADVLRREILYLDSSDDQDGAQVR
jgi:hypothetical protein